MSSLGGEEKSISLIFSFQWGSGMWKFKSKEAFAEDEGSFQRAGRRSGQPSLAGAKLWQMPSQHTDTAESCWSLLSQGKELPPSTAPSASLQPEIRHWRSHLEAQKASEEL